MKGSYKFREFSKSWQFLLNKVHCFYFLQVEEFFQDFDPLRHGSISVSRFRMGLSAMGQDHLSEAQILAIINRYADPKTQFHVLWTKFLTDIEEGNVILFRKNGFKTGVTIGMKCFWIVLYCLFKRKPFQTF